MGTKVAFPSGPRLAANNRTDLNILTLTDSTGEAYNEWPGRFLDLVAAANPHLSFTYEEWWSNGAEAWGAESSKQVGTGTKTVKLWNAGGSGYLPTSFTEDMYLHPDAVDYIVIALGHNGTTGYTDLVSAVQAAWPTAHLTICTQNTRDYGAGYVVTDFNAYTRALAATLKVGLIDIEPVFLALGDDIGDYMGDAVHPNDTGRQLWADTAFSYWTASTSLTLQSRRAAA